MITLIPIENNNVVGLKIDGKIETRDIKKVESLIEEQLKLWDKLRIYVELESLGGISFEAFLEDLKFAFRHFQDFEKKAVVCDKKWVNKLADAINPLFPQIEVKCFSKLEQNQALEWIKAEKPETSEHLPA